MSPPAETLVGAWPADLLRQTPASTAVEGTATSRLVTEARQGCHEAYRRLVEHHRDRVFRYCLAWSGNREDAEELCQDTFVRAYSALPRYRDEGQFLAWLYTIARNRCHDFHRRETRRRLATHQNMDGIGEKELVSPRPAPDEQAVESEALRRLRAAIAGLPERLREVLILCGIEGMSHESCAELLGCSTRAVEGRLYRARRELAEAYGIARSGND